MKRYIHINKKEIELFSGVGVRDNYLHLRFTIQGKRYSQSLKLTVNEKSIKKANQKIEAIKYEIANNTFCFEHHFPHAKKLLVTNSNSKTINVIDAFIETKRNSVQKSTLNNYQSNLKQFLKLIGENSYLSSISKRRLIEIRNELLKKYNKRTVSFRIIIINMFLSWLYDSRYNLTKLKIDTVSPPAPQPDPFTKEEKSLMDQHAASEEEIDRNIVTRQLALRACEVSTIDCIDLEKKEITIQYSLCEQGNTKELKMPKTNK